MGFRNSTVLAFAAAPEAFAQCVDLDGDGFTTCQNDCDDSDPLVNPGVPDDDCDRFSDDCDSKIDEDTQRGRPHAELGPAPKPGMFCRPEILLDTCVPFDPAPNDATCDGRTTIATDLWMKITHPRCRNAESEHVAIREPRPALTVRSWSVNPAPNDATCNGIDDDCDGAVDENL